MGFWASFLEFLTKQRHEGAGKYMFPDKTAADTMLSGDSARKGTDCDDN